MQQTEKTKILTKDFLYNEIIINKKTKKQIAEETNLSLTTIVHYMKKYDIPIYKDYHCRFNDKEMEEIIDLYVNKKISAYKIGKMYGTTHKIIISSLQKCGIKTRGMQESLFVFNGKEIDERFLDRNWLYEQYCEKRLSMNDIANILNYDPSTIQEQLRKFNIPIRTAGESKTGVYSAFFTPLNILVRGHFRRHLIPKVLKRDNHTCQVCGKKDTKLHVHHIVRLVDIYNEILSENSQYNPNDNEDKLKLYKIISEDERILNLNNLITLCEECHKKVHSKNKTISNQALF